MEVVVAKFILILIAILIRADVSYPGDFTLVKIGNQVNFIWQIFLL
jgi:hypothetical protein